MTDYQAIAKAIRASIDRSPYDRSPYEDYLALLNTWTAEDSEIGHADNRLLFRRIVIQNLNSSLEDPLARIDDADMLHQTLYKSLVLSAPAYFEDYLQAVEFNRPNEKKFYAPRRRYLKRIVDEYQAVADGKYRFLSISLPKRAGKSQTGINFVLWLSGRNPNGSSLMEGTGDALVRSFYQGCLEYLVTPNEYSYYDIFPGSRLRQTNADINTINLDEKSRFPTVMCRSIDARQVGLSEATNVLYLDDCVEGREEAKNRIQLDKKWEIISGDVMGRALEGTPLVMCGTRYSLYDPIGRMQEYATEHNWNWKAVEIPALDPITDESNYEFFNPKTGLPMFTTGYFREQRDLLTAEQFESEFQQQPFEAKGMLFPKDKLNYYFSLPSDREPDGIIAFGDTAERGSDYTAVPVGYLYGEEVYIHDVVFDDSVPEITKPSVVDLLYRNHVGQATFESNNAGEYYARDVDKMLKERGGRTSIRNKRTISNKQTRIELASDYIMKHFWFRHPSTYERNSQYAQFMLNVTTYTRSGKVPHDDAPDSLAMMENGLRTILGVVSAQAIDRPF